MPATEETLAALLLAVQTMQNELYVLLYTVAFISGLICVQLAINGKNARRLW